MHPHHPFFRYPVRVQPSTLCSLLFPHLPRANQPLQTPALLLQTPLPPPTQGRSSQGLICPAEASLNCLSPPGPAFLYGNCRSQLQGDHTCPCTIHLEMAVFPSYPGRNWSVAERGLMLEMTRLDGAPGSSGHRGEREGGDLNPATAQERYQTCQQQPLSSGLYTKTGFIFTTARVRSTAFLPRILKEHKGLSVRLPSDNDLVPSKEDGEGVCTPSISGQLEMGGERVPSRRLPGSGFQDNRTQVKVQNWSLSACGLMLWQLNEGRWALRVAPRLRLAVAKPPP